MTVYYQVSSHDQYHVYQNVVRIDQANRTNDDITYCIYVSGTLAPTMLTIHSWEQLIAKW